MSSKNVSNRRSLNFLKIKKVKHCVKWRRDIQCTRKCINLPFLKIQKKKIWKSRPGKRPKKHKLKDDQCLDYHLVTESRKAKHSFLFLALIRLPSPSLFDILSLRVTNCWSDEFAFLPKSKTKSRKSINLKLIANSQVLFFGFFRPEKNLE